MTERLAAVAGYFRHVLINFFNFRHEGTSPLDLNTNTYDRSHFQQRLGHELASVFVDRKYHPAYAPPRRFRIVKILNNGNFDPHYIVPTTDQFRGLDVSLKIRFTRLQTISTRPVDEQTPFKGRTPENTS
jgi:hypothetical protein